MPHSRPALPPPTPPMPAFMSLRTVFTLCTLTLALTAAERLDRGVAAFPTKDGQVYVGWRLLADDPANVGFDVYRSDSPSGTPRKLNSAPITDSTNYVDRTGGATTGAN